MDISFEKARDMLKRGLNAKVSDAMKVQQEELSTES